MLKRTSIPTIQVMSDVVAIAALGETGHHARRVRYAMTSLTARNRLVLVFVTGNAVDTFVLGIGLAVHLESLLVT